MSRRKNLVVREPNGRRQREPQLPSPGEVTRLRTAALAGMRDPVWSSTLGWLFLAGKISPSQFAAGKKWADLVKNYSAACQSPKPPRSARLDPDGAMAADPDSQAGRREARRHVKTVEGYLAGLNALKRISEPPRRAVRDVCELEQMPIGQDGLKALQIGLQTLVAFWMGERK